jgi:TolB-like protein/ketosteroid isomerase-like protein
MTEHDEKSTVAQAQPQILGDFELLDKLGGGGMGAVYRARQLSMQREVAVKILHEHLASDTAFVDRFYREAHASGKLTHPNIIRGIAAGKAGDRFYFAMEFVDGESVSELLKRHGRLPAGEVARIGLEVARALDHAHSRQIVHRDIKPANIMIDREGVVKVADLGLAKARSEESGLTQAGAVYGTPAFMAPEQASDAASADQRSDIYSLGVTLYFLLTGAKPFAGTSAELLGAKRTGVYRPIRECEPAVPETFERIVDKMMRPDPKQRFQTAAEVAAAIEATGLAGAQPIRPAPSASRRRGRSLLLAAAGAVGVAIVAAAALVVLPALRQPSNIVSDTPRADAQGLRLVAEVPKAETKPVALGVMLFKMHGGGTSDEWKREAVRDGLNAQLSRLSQVKVYSKEFIDFLITRKQLTEIEAATQLGIKKMLSGSVVVMGSSVQVETHIVDVASGVLEASYTTTGSTEEILDVPVKLAREAIARLDLPTTEAERQVLFAQQERTNAEALKLLLQAEGGAAAPPDAEPRSDAAGGPRRLARLLGQWPAAAFAAEESGAEAEIKQLLERYRDATVAREIKQLADLYVGFTKEQETAQQRYFDNVRDLKVVLDAVEIAVVGDEGVVSYTRTDDFVDARTGRPMHASVRLTKLLRKDGDAWKLVGGN